MFEIFRMQLGQILGGRMKWLVVLCLTLPVLLTLAAVSGGGLDELHRELGREQIRQALNEWLKKKGVMKSERKRAVTRKRP